MKRDLKKNLNKIGFKVLLISVIYLAINFAVNSLTYTTTAQIAVNQLNGDGVDLAILNSWSGFMNNMGVLLQLIYVIVLSLSVSKNLINIKKILGEKKEI